MRIRVTAPMFAALAVVAAACGGSPAASPSSNPPVPSSAGSSAPASPTQSAVPPQSPVPVENNPPGDIPDTVQYVPYPSSKGGFVVKVPEGWSRTTSTTSVFFTDGHQNSIEASWKSATSAPAAASAKSNDVPMLQSTELAFQLSKIIDCSPSCTIPFTTGQISTKLTADAVVITYKANSKPDPNAPTNKQYRLEEIRFELFKGGQETDLTLSCAVGSDNVDPWRIVSESFRWS